MQAVAHLENGSKTRPLGFEAALIGGCSNLTAFRVDPLVYSHRLSSWIDDTVRSRAVFLKEKDIKLYS